VQEKSEVLGELALKARMTTETLNTIEGVSCNEVMGAMYAFPRIFLPDKAVAEAKVYIPSLFLFCSLIWKAFRRFFSTYHKQLPQLVSRMRHRLLRDACGGTLRHWN